jgi:D-alanyl-D-alanine carboxypeptidase
MGMQARAGALVLACATALLAFSAGPVAAQVGSDRYASVVIEATTGNTLEAVNADEPRHPASLAKLMTLYMLFEALRDRRLTLATPVPVSAHAASMSPSKLGLVPGTRLTVEEAILGLVTKSANDAAAAVGELLGGDEDRFAQMMTLRARALGMSRSTFQNASGLPDPDAWTTARDMATLARRILTDFPGYYGYFSTPSFSFHGRFIPNHDHMLETYPGADGMKTGYTIASGFNLVTSAMRGGVRLVGVVLGAASTPERDYHMAGLLDQGFERMDVPVGRREPLVARGGMMPSLVPSAQAATLTMIRPAGRAVAQASAKGGPRFGVQVGAFPTEHAAREAAGAARRVADGGEARVEPTGAGHGRRPVWRAQLFGLTEGEAQEVCAAMQRRRAACFVLRPEAGQIASR